MLRYVALLLLVILPAMGAIGRASAIEQGPGELDPRLDGYPTLTISLTAERIEVIGRVAAGRTLVIEESIAPETGHAFIARVPDDVTEAEVRAATAAGTAPLARNPEPPAWLFRSLFVGNPDRAAPNGGRVFALVDLVPGRYLVWHPYRSPAEGARFEVAEGAPVAYDADRQPPADVEAKMYEMAFDLPSAVPAGRQLWHVMNAGTALHEIAILPVPADATTEQVETALMAALAAEAAGMRFEGQPAPADFGASWADWRLRLLHGVGVTSPGRSVWATFDLLPGTYAAVCFVPDPVSGIPHLMMGMTEVFTVVS